MTDAGNNRVRVECPHCGKEAYSIPTACSHCGAPGGDHTGSCMAAARADATRNRVAVVGAIRMGLPLTADSSVVAERILRKIETAGFKVVPE